MWICPLGGADREPLLYIISTHFQRRTSFLLSLSTPFSVFFSTMTGSGLGSLDWPAWPPSFLSSIHVMMWRSELSGKGCFWIQKVSKVSTAALLTKPQSKTSSPLSVLEILLRPFEAINMVTASLIMIELPAMKFRNFPCLTSSVP